MRVTLIIMAAGIGSRFGTGIKQLARVDDSDHIIMDYSIHDAIEAGFRRIVFVIRRDIEAEFREVIGRRIEAVCEALNVEVEYAYQQLEEIPGKLPAGRTKPWGTGQAVLAAKDLVDGPFAVINADDYYGREPYRMVHDFLCRETGEFCLAGYVLRNTLSEHGSVTRGVCLQEGAYLAGVEETHGIEKTEGGAAAEGVPLDPDALVSMNLWGFTREFMEQLETGFAEFFARAVPADPLKAEFLIPVYVGELLERGAISGPADGPVRVRVLPTGAKWCGMTYQEDIPVVRAEFRGMIEAGVYERDLYSDLRAAGSGD